MQLSLKNKGEKGVVLYLGIIIMGIIMAISLALSVILVNQIRIIRSIGDSVIAFYAADSGMEQTLKHYKDDSCNIVGFEGEIIENNAEYKVTDSTTYTDPVTENIYCILESYGSFQNTQRRIEVKIEQ